MPDASRAAGPGVDAAAVATAGTMFAALIGDFVPHDASGDEGTVDAYSAFLQRSIAMGWQDDTSAGGGSEDHLTRAGGLWSMNDAGLGEAISSAGERLACWFQVEASAPAADRPLPVQPFLGCAAQAAAKLGEFALRRLQVLLPVQGIDARSRPASALVPSLATKDWFAAGPPQPRTPVRMTVSSGQDPSMTANAQRFAGLIRGLHQDVLVVTSVEVGLPGDLRQPPFPDDFWNGPAQHGLRLHGELAEWSCDSLGWFAAIIADCAAQAGVRSPLLFDAVRADAQD